MIHLDEPNFDNGDASNLRGLVARTVFCKPKRDSMISSLQNYFQKNKGKRDSRKSARPSQSFPSSYSSMTTREKTMAIINKPSQLEKLKNDLVSSKMSTNAGIQQILLLELLEARLDEMEDENRAKTSEVVHEKKCANQEQKQFSPKKCYLPSTAPNDNTYHNREKVIEVIAPPGKLGVAIKKQENGAHVFHIVKDWSPVADKLNVGDQLIAVDNEDVLSFSSEDVRKTLSEKSTNPKRNLTVVQKSTAAASSTSSHRCTSTRGMNRSVTYSPAC